MAARAFPEFAKAIVVHEAGGELMMEDRKVQEPQRGKVLVKTIACGICHSDAIVKDGLMPVPYPLVPGHEIVGRVVAVGPDEKKWKVGQFVGGSWEGGHDGVCDDCRRGDFMNCENKEINGVSKDGGYAQYVLLNTESVVNVPEDMPPAEVAPLMCAGLTTFNAMRNMPDLRPGDLVAVQGIGGLGHLAIQFARNMGYRVAALSSTNSKRDLAIALGAHYFIVPGQKSQAEQLLELGGAKVIVATAPNPESISSILNGIAANGTLLTIAPTGSVPFDTIVLNFKRASVRGWPSGTPIDVEDTLAFAKLQGIKPEVQTYNGLDIAEVRKAYSTMADGSVRFRAVLMFE